MPLSDREQQILTEIEKGLLTEDPDLAGAGPADGRRVSRRMKLGLVVFVVGIGSLVGFFVTQSLILGLTAFGAMVAGIVLIATAVRDLATEGFRDFDARRRMAEKFGDWEGKLRNRYRR